MPLTKPKTLIYHEMASFIATLIRQTSYRLPWVTGTRRILAWISPSWYSTRTRRITSWLGATIASSTWSIRKLKWWAAPSPCEWERVWLRGIFDILAYLFGRFVDGRSLICYYYPFVHAGPKIYLRVMEKSCRCPYTFPVFDPVFKRICIYKWRGVHLSNQASVKHLKRLFLNKFDKFEFACAGRGNQLKEATCPDYTQALGYSPTTAAHLGRLVRVTWPLSYLALNNHIPKRTLSPQSKYYKLLSKLTVRLWDTLSKIQYDNIYIQDIVSTTMWSKLGPQWFN